MKKYIEKKDLILIITIFTLLFLIHIPLLSNNILTADVLLNNSFYSGYAWELSLGRFGLFITGLLKSYLSIPHIELIISYLLISITTLLLLKLFNIQEKIPTILTILLLTLSPIISATLLFHYCSVGYTLAFFGGTLALFLFNNINNKYIKIILPICLIILSLSMYQAYLSYIVTLFILYNIKQILDKNINWKDFYQYIIVLGISIISYFVLMKVSQIILHIDMASYSNANSIGLSTLLSFPIKIVNAYTLFYRFFFTNEFIKNAIFHNNIINMLLIILAIITYILHIKKNQLSNKEIIIATLLVLLLPIFVNSIIFVIADAKLQLLMSTSYLLLPIFLFSLLKDKTTVIISTILCTILFRNYLIQIQATYITLESTYNTYHTIIGNAINQNINQLDKKYAIIGKIKTKDNNLNRIKKLNYGYISDEDIFWEEYNLRKIGFERFVEQYFGLDINFVEEETYLKLIIEQDNNLIYEQEDAIIINLNNY